MKDQQTDAAPQTGSDSVLQLIKARAATGSRPGNRADGRKLALAIEGGGMRGVVSGGMVAAIEELNLLNCFDAVYGSSAGAICGAYLVAQQARLGVTIFYENINNRDFIDLRRFFFSKQPTLSLSYLLDKVCIEDKPLDTARILNSPIPLHIVSTSVTTLKSVVFSNFRDAKEIFNALRASARIPIVAGGPVEYKEDHYFDASVVESVPYQSAIDAGYTDVLALLTRPKGAPRESNWIDRFLIAPRLKAYNHKLPDIYLAREGGYLKELEDIAKYSSSRSNALPRILPIQKPAASPAVRSHETDRQKLVAGAMSGFRSVYEGLDFPIPQLVEVITPISKISPLPG